MQRGIITLYDKLKGDKVIWFVLFLLCFASLLAVYSATGSMAYRSGGHSTQYYLFKQLVFIFLGLGIAYVAHRIHYEHYLRWAPYIFIVAVVLLILTFFFGMEVNSAKRWLQIPILKVSFQTSDLGKFGLILMLARVLSMQNFVVDEIGKFGKLMMIIGIVCLLIAPMDFSTSVMLFCTSMVIMFIGRVNVKYMILTTFSIVILISALFVAGTYFPESVRAETWLSRIQSFSSGDNYQMIQSKIAIANGGLIGEGPGNSIQRNFLPSPYSDFIYAIICEEYGILGGASILVIYLLLLIRVTRIVNRCKRRFGILVAYGFGFGIIFQAAMNIAVSVDLIPVTGITLPIISMGGSSMLFTCLAFGIILSVSNHTENLIESETAEAVGEEGAEDEIDN